MEALRLYVDVARCHSFSHAAEMHGITQSAASQRISALEKKLGVTLFDRSVRPLGLTDAGKAFLDGLEDVLERYDRLEEKVGAMARAEAEGVVRVAAIYSAGIELLSHVREAFEAAHPKLDVRIRYEQPDHVHAAVLDGEADLGIVSYPASWKRVGIIPLRDETMAVVCRTGHELAGRTEVTPADLVGHELATFEAELPVGRHIRAYLREHDVLSEISVSNVFDNIDTIKTAVAFTDQVSILPKRTVAREVEAGTLAAIRLEPRLTRPMGVIVRTPKRRAKADDPKASLPAGARAFVDFLVEHAGPEKEETGHTTRKPQMAEAAPR